jgi:hypothetical protein
VGVVRKYSHYSGRGSKWDAPSDEYSDKYPK